MNKNPKKYFDRDLSWLSFNYRVLDEVRDAELPIFERIKFLAIYSSNLDEFFRVRVANLRSLAELDKKVPTADPLSKEFYEAQCARISADIDQPFCYSYLIRDYLSRMTPMPDLPGLAARLNIETRTLQRLLAKEEKTFSSILKDVRCKRAVDRLQYSDFSVEQIAQELGFNDAVAFSHAFKAWMGFAPRQWRAEQATL